MIRIAKISYSAHRLSIGKHWQHSFFICLLDGGITRLLPLTILIIEYISDTVYGYSMRSSVLSTLLIVYFWIGAFWKGYFMETAFFSLNCFLYAGFIANLCLSREFVFSKIHIFILLFVTGYWVTVMFAVDVEQAVLEAARVSGLLPLSLMIMMLPADKLTRLYKMWPWIGAFTVFAGIVFGMERNGRLESTFFYANALAIFLLVSIAVCILSFLQERHNKIYLLLLMVNAVGLLLTFSRSVWVQWLLMVCAAIVWFPEMRKRSKLIYIGLAHVCSLVLAMLIKGDLLFFWHRASTIQSNTAEFQIRLVYWKDSLAMIRDYWWGGTGGGGWNVLVHMYRSQDYFVKYVHNHFIQIALDIGIFGLIVFMVWLGIFYSTAIKRLRHGNDQESIWTKGIILVVTIMLLHAGFDFDLTFPFLFGMLVCLTAPLGGTTYRLRVPKRAFGFIVPAAVGLICLWSWLAMGYGYNQAGNASVKQGHYTEAQESFAKAERLLPWSSSVLYSSAKGYVHQGNITGRTVYYKLAEEKLLLAHAMVPEQILYMELLNQLSSIFRQKTIDAPSR